MKPLRNQDHRHQMHVVFHPGAHHTEEDRLMKCLLRNKEDFCNRGVAVPGPSRYRTLLKDAFNALRNAPPAPEARDVLLDAILDEERADRLILSNAHFFGSPRFAVAEGQFYPLAGERVAQLRQLFPSDQVEVFMAIRNPAGFLPAVMGTATQDELDSRLAGRDPRELRWSDTMARIHETAPDVRLTVWCHEDAPLIWGAIIQGMAGLEEDVKITGAFDLLGAIMSGEGMKRFRAHLREYPDLGERRKRDVMADYLEEYALEDQLEEELNLPGWTDALVDELTAIYEADMQRLCAIPGLRIIAP